ncbi:MAG: electron transport complex protein RnfG [Bermanella sp.]|jgi:electron transport complex protein RnfG
MLVKSISKNSVLLGIFATVTTAIIAGTYLSSRDLIKANIRAAEEKALLQIIPEDRHDNSMLDDTVAVDNTRLLGLREAKAIYLASLEGKFIGAILPATTREGYTGDIDMIVGVNRDGSLAGVRILQHRETPGLGDAVDRKKSDWVEGFVGKSIGNPQAGGWTVKKDGGVFDQFTGATITPRAVTKTVFQALQYFQEHRDHLIAATENEKTHSPSEAASGPASKASANANAAQETTP